jgi:tRNA(fMet)-specific endonuclease VapC
MLDTNICSYIIKNRPQSILHKFKSLPEEACLISSVTLAELRYWIARNYQHHQSSKNAGVPKINEDIINQFLSRLNIEAFGYEAAGVYGEMRALFESKGTPVGSEDLMIGSHALSLRCTLVTNNIREFERFPGLKIENWIANI